MRAGKRFYLLVGALLIAVFASSPAAYAQTVTQGGVQQGIKVTEIFTDFHQDEYSPYADNLEFKAWQKEDNININGWRITISHFTASSSARGSQPPPYDAVDNGLHAIDVTASGAQIPFCTKLVVKIEFWLTSWNTIRKADVEWTLGADSTKTVPDHGWVIEDPSRNPPDPSMTKHLLKIHNDDQVAGFWATGIKYLASTTDYSSDLSAVPFPADSLPSTWLAPGDSLVIDALTPCGWYGDHIYHTFAIREDDLGSPDYGQAPEGVVIADHIVTKPVPTMSTWGLIALGLLLTAAGTVAVWRMRRPRMVKAS